MHPGKIVATSQEVEVQVLEVDPVKRRISLGLKQTLANPWQSFAEKFPVGSEVEGEVKNKTEFGLFIGLDGDVDGMVHLSDLDWNKPGEQVIEDYKKGDVVKAKVLDVDIEKERISLGVKQLATDPFAAKSGDAAAKSGEDPTELKKGSVVTCEVLEVKDGGLDVKIVGTDFTAFIKRNELARDRADQPAERFAIGEKVDARITLFDLRRREKCRSRLRRWKWLKRRKPSRNMAPPISWRVTGRYSRRCAESSRRGAGRRAPRPWLTNRLQRQAALPRGLCKNKPVRRCPCGLFLRHGFFNTCKDFSMRDNNAGRSDRRRRRFRHDQ